MSELVQIEQIARVKQGRYTAPSELSEKPTGDANVPVWGANGILGYTQNATYEEAQPLVTCRGNGCGLVQWSGGRSHVSNNAMAIVLKDACPASSKYLYYSLFASKFDDVTTGSAQPQITMGHLNKKEIFWHSDASERNSIAHILGALDDKIELNQKMNETLEDIAKAIFKSWFVDFDPVRAKAEGRPTGLPAEISDLFPDAFEDSEIGEIPAGWEIRSGSDIYSHQKGLSYKGEFLSDSPVDIPMLNLGSFAGNGGYREEKLKFYRGDFKDRHCINEGDLLLANTDLTQDRLIIGSPILVPNAPSGHRFYLHTHHTTKITPRDKSGVSSIFLYFTFLQSSFRERVSGFATGTTVLALPKDTFDALQLIIPSLSARVKFEEIVTPILARRTLIATENGVLRELRDTLLPKLISGELRIPDAEKFLEEAGI
ncbi:MAG: hypothetical protein DCO98_01225 [Altererythrobacter sp. XM-24bin4]|uniref:restriction endonuclease subunit S n=1 Tax=uncultured Altererythrobacter sp. TaxID=500840 RepID=UPI000D7B5058|nr:restriction endonuclease subunit S [uncultured Altererythrobacter sp.]PWL26758.1 MAG: hypothetical protein DCO98_01225 [Altererythrobacter sp. XM-24bin4]